MKRFMDKDFLLETETAGILYHDYAKDMPIFDYHCHLSPREIAENKSFENMTEIWLDGDHYKWRALRNFGVSEDYITGNKSDKEKFDKWAETVPYTLGNPLYHWTHLELQRYFDIHEPLSPANADEIWETCNHLLQQDRFTARALIERSNVNVVCTTDDPADDLKYHKQIAADPSFHVKVLPTFRPDPALNIEQEGFIDWLQRLETAVGADISSYREFTDALKQRIRYFHEHGCRISDHSLESSFHTDTDEQEVERIFQKRLHSERLSEREGVQFRSAVLQTLGAWYAELGWVMQLHIGALRNNNTRKLIAIGPNAGFDSMADFTFASELSRFLDSLDVREALPKTVIYCLNPRDNYMVASMAGNFQEGPHAKVQFGTAWWFNDQRDGMEDQIKTLANVGLLSTFIGMLTDSRSFLSFTRHEYFRRILCNVIGKWVENGEYPADMETLGKIVKGICYENINRYIETESL